MPKPVLGPACGSHAAPFPFATDSAAKAVGATNKEATPRSVAASVARASNRTTKSGANASFNPSRPRTSVAATKRLATMIVGLSHAFQVA
jgi:hypothetical protein